MGGPTQAGTTWRCLAPSCCPQCFCHPCFCPPFFCPLSSCLPSYASSHVGCPLRSIGGSVPLGWNSCAQRGCKTEILMTKTWVGLPGPGHRGAPLRHLSVPNVSVIHVSVRCSLTPRFLCVNSRWPPSTLDRWLVPSFHKELHAKTRRRKEGRGEEDGRDSPTLTKLGNSAYNEAELGVDRP